jgi:hypothetical protein
MSRLVYILKISSLCFFHTIFFIVHVLYPVQSEDSRRPRVTSLVGGGGAMVAKDVASVSDLVAFMKKERLKIFFPSTQHVISMKNED